MLLNQYQQMCQVLNVEQGSSLYRVTTVNDILLGARRGGGLPMHAALTLLPRVMVTFTHDEHHLPCSVPLVTNCHQLDILTLVQCGLVAGLSSENDETEAMF